MSKIVVLKGSPRKGRNTDKLADAFIESARAAGNEVEEFSAAGKKIGGCIGCYACMQNGGECVQKDDMRPIYDALLTADSIVFASPIYYFSYTAQMKAMIDRLFAPMLGKKLNVKSAALLLTFGGEHADEDAPGALAEYDALVKYTGWENKGIVYAASADDAPIEDHPAMEQARALGASM